MNHIFSKSSLFRAFASFVILIGASACIEHRVKSEPIEVKPIKVEPIEITVNVNVRVQERLEHFFAFEEEVEQQIQEPTEPTSP